MWSLIFLEGEYLVCKIKGKKRERIGSTRRRKKMVCQGETILRTQRRKKLGQVLSFTGKEEN